MQDPTVEDMQEIVNKLTKENQQLHTAQLGEYEIFEVLLKQKYPDGLPFFANHGHSLAEVYPEIYKQAQAIIKAQKDKGE